MTSKAGGFEEAFPFLKIEGNGFSFSGSALRPNRLRRDKLGIAFLKEAQDIAGLLAGKACADAHMANGHFPLVVPEFGSVSEVVPRQS